MPARVVKVGSWIDPCAGAAETPDSSIINMEEPGGDSLYFPAILIPTRVMATLVEDALLSIAIELARLVESVIANLADVA